MGRREVIEEGREDRGRREEGKERGRREVIEGWRREGI